VKRTVTKYGNIVTLFGNYRLRNTLSCKPLKNPLLYIIKGQALVRVKKATGEASSPPGQCRGVSQNRYRFLPRFAWSSSPSGEYTLVADPSRPWNLISLL